MSLPYFPMYPTDFEADTSHLTLAEDGAYNRILRLMWMTPGCSLPDDHAWIARRMRVDPDTFATVVLPLIGEFFRTSGGRISSPRLTQEWQKADITYGKRRLAGKLGGRPKAIENTQKGVKAGLSLGLQPEPEPEPDKVREKEDAIASKKKPNLPLPDGWVPNNKNLSDARSKHMTDGEIEDAATEFANYHHKHDNRYRDWNAAWRTWLGNRNKYSKPHATTEAIAIAARFARSPSADSF